MRAYAIVNMDASGFAGRTPSSLAEILTAAFADQGASIVLDIVRGPDVAQAVARATESEASRIVIGGGDGSLRTAAQALLGTQKELGIWPGGTLNRFAWDLGMPADLEAAAAVLAQGRPHPVDVLDLNGEPILCQCYLGLTPQFTAARQRLRGKPLLARIEGYGRSLVQVFRARRRLALKIDDGNEARLVRALSVAVSNNPFADELTPLPHRERLDSGKLGLYISRHRSGGEMAWLLARAAMGDWRDAPHVTAITADAVRITSKAKRLLASVDGEIRRLRTPLDFRMRPGALQVVRPLAECGDSGPHLLFG